MRFSDAARFTLVAIAAVATAASAQASNDDPNGKSFYITEPSCNSYQCHYKIHQGHKMHINWLNPIKGRINILLTPNEGTSGLESYTIAHHIAADNHNNKCDHGGQPSCGMYEWTVPDSVKPGLYSVDIHSLYNKKVHGYSDIVEVKAATSSAKKTHKKRLAVDV